MVWRREDPQGNEAGKITWELVKWTRGRGLDIGCGPTKGFPHFIGVDSGADINLFGIQMKPDVWIDDASDLRLFASNQYDFVFSSHLLEHIAPEKLVQTLKEWLRVIKNDGYLIMYLPDENLYPKVGEEGANPDHKWNVSYEKVIDLMRKAGNWDLLDWQRRDQGMEYSLFFVFQKKAQGQMFSCAKPRLQVKRAAVVRYGAYGDILQASSVFKGLKEQGYHVTVFCSPPGNEAILHDPNIDEFYYQDKDQVPNQYLDKFWDWHKQKYDLWINMCESAEGTLLSIPNRFLHRAPPRLREQLTNLNYLEVQHELAGVPHKPRVKFYPTEAEREWAKAERARMNKKVIVWSLAGSSVHKTWPWVDNVLAALLIQHKDISVVFVGGDSAVLLEQGWFKVGEDGRPERDKRGRKAQVDDRVHCLSGDWSIRESMAFVQVADIVVGPETGILNAVSNEPMRKVVILSHSTVNNLTRDWDNTTSIYSPVTHCPGRGKNEAQACHQLHYNWDHCQQARTSDGELTGVAQCQYDIPAAAVYDAISEALQKLEEAQAA
jgi:ADP-heptose:LPS heptosyltransferase/predicted SAM-dependent methyltransferase